MSTDAKRNPVFTGPFEDLLAGFVREKRASGYKYDTAIVYLLNLDTFLKNETVCPDELTKDVVERWTQKMSNEQEKTHYSRVSILRQFALYLSRQGIPAYMPPREKMFCKSGFVPRIFTHEEIRRMFEILDNWRCFSDLPYRHLVLPELFRMLYGCGLRIGEALNLEVRDVDLTEGILTIRNAKFGKERLVPMAPTLAQRLKTYASKFGVREQDAPFFPGSDGRHLSHAVVYNCFRDILWQLGIPHIGRNRGPRIHDLRHTFAVHRLLRWYQEGADMGVMLPRLSTYLGHVGMEGTQRYLHMVAELMPEVTKTLEAAVGHMIPGGDEI
ncbi:MAG: tyrosine-type recombinase/integrase [Armatimonadota bacterium]